MEALTGDGHRVMLDLKLHDIPHTVAGAVHAAGELGAELLVHALGGTALIEAAAQAAGPGGVQIAAVTVLANLVDAGLAELGLPGAAESVPRLAALAVAAGAGAIVCSPWRPPPCVPPPARPGSSALACARPRRAPPATSAAYTPAGAVEAGADLLVVGRPVTGRPDVRAAAAAIRDQAGSAHLGQGGASH